MIKYLLEYFENKKKMKNSFSKRLRVVVLLIFLGNIIFANFTLAAINSVDAGNGFPAISDKNTADSVTSTEFNRLKNALKRLYNDDSNSYIGIGTSSPQSPLHIRASGFSQLRLDSSTTNQSAGAYLRNNLGRILAIETTNSAEPTNPNTGIIYGRDGLSKIQIGFGRNTPLWTALNSGVSPTIGIGTVNPCI